MGRPVPSISILSWQMLPASMPLQSDADFFKWDHYKLTQLLTQREKPYL
jgi:hypothetical protein